MSEHRLIAKMTVETSDGLIYEFPNVDLSVSADIEPEIFYGDPGYYYEQGPAYISSMKIEGRAFKGKNGDIVTVRMKPKKKKKK